MQANLNHNLGYIGLPACSNPWTCLSWGYIGDNGKGNENYYIGSRV